MDSTTDMLGQRVATGDRVAVAFRAGNSAELRVGTVVGFSDVSAAYTPGNVNGRQPTLVIEWEPQRGYSVKQSGIWISNKRFVRIS